MTDGVNVDFSLLKPANPVGDYANAFAVGRHLGVSRATGNTNALTGAPRDPIAALAPDQRAGAARRADILAGVGAGLKSVDYAERAGILAHMAPALAAQGVPPGMVAAFDPTDANLDDIIGQARGIVQRLGGLGLAGARPPTQRGAGPSEADDGVVQEGV